MKLALAQMKMKREVAANYRKSLDLLARAKRHGADLILFPEIQCSPFFPQYESGEVSDYVMTMEDPVLHGLCQACRDHQIWASPNLYVEQHGERFDRSFLIDDQGVIRGTQDMVHIAQCENFYEQSYYTPSREGFRAFDTPFGRIGIVVCFDRHYPESIRTEALQGADLILIPTANTTGEPEELFQWEIRVQAFQNSVNIAMCNRTGQEGRMTFSGASLVCSPSGDLIAMAGDGEELLLAEVDLPAASAMRRAKPYTALRRTEYYL